MNIGQAAQACGLTEKAIRFYESIGLVHPDRHPTNGYRIYSLGHIEQLRFLQRARTAGFDIETCRQLLGFYSDKEARDDTVKASLDNYLQQLDQQLIAVNAMRENLLAMVDECTRQAVADRPVGERETRAPIMPFTLIDSRGD